jgi:hypothetical protein
VRAATPDGEWVVDTVTLSATTRNLRDGEWLRLRRRGYFAGEFRTVAELQAFDFPFSDLQEVRST